MFESMLAKRYISTQKRHAVLTVCSIAIAIALMTMLFTALATLLGCMRDIIYEQEPYHIRFNGLTKEEAETVAVYAEEYGTATVEEAYAKDGTYWVCLVLKENISSADKLVQEVSKKAGFSQPIKNINVNSDLMMLDMKDDTGRGLMAIYVALFYVFALFLAMMVRLVIDTAFEVSSKERERQFGVLQSIGATPKQIVRIITLEGLMLSGIGLPIGVLLGIGVAYAGFKAVISTGFLEFTLNADQIDRLLKFHVNPWLLLIGVVTGALWVLLSAYGTGMRVIRMTPMQAISARSNTVNKVNRHSVFGALFGWTGRLASRNNRRNLKRFVITVISLTLSITLFSAVGIIVDSVLEVAEKNYELFNIYDFSVYYDGDFSEDRFLYQKPMERLEESGLFSEFYFSLSEFAHYAPGGDPYDENQRTSFRVMFCSEDSYNEQFLGNPPISYEELTKSGGYLFTGEGVNDFPQFLNDTVTMYVSDYKQISAEEYEELSEEDKAHTDVLGYIYNPETNDDDIPLYGWNKMIETEFKITAMAASGETFGHEWISPTYNLITTLDIYESGDYVKLSERYASMRSGIFCNLADYQKYREAGEFIDQNRGVFSYFVDNTAERRQIVSVLSAIKIGAGFLNAMFALIAIVNMVNILSTGILNRRGEIASMQCVGMTERQLYKMTFVECLQYALSSGIMALILCEGLMFATYRLFVDITIVEEFGQFISYVKPIPRVLIAAALTFIVALIASLIPLRGMRSRSLVEHIHSVE